MAELSAKKAKKEKKRLAMLEQTDLNGSYNSETNTNKKSKKKKDKGDTSVTEAKPELPDTDLNGSYNSETNTNKKKKKKRDTDTSVTEDLPVINDSVKQTPQKDDAKKSQVRSGKQRMMVSTLLLISQVDLLGLIAVWTVICDPDPTFLKISILYLFPLQHWLQYRNILLMFEICKTSTHVYFSPF